MLEPKQPTTAAQVLREAWFDTWQATEPLATDRGVALWRATDGSGGSALLRLYPRFQSESAWRRFSTVATQRAKLDHPRLLPLAKLGAHGRPHLLLSDPVGEPLATRIEREPLRPETAAQVFDDVAAALEALADAGIGPVELTPADVFLVAGDRGLLLADAGLLQQVEGEREGAPRPTAASMSRSFAALLQAALTGPADGSPSITPAIDRLLTRALAANPCRGYRTPAQIVGAFRKALIAGNGAAPRAQLKVVPPKPAPAPAEASAPPTAPPADQPPVAGHARRGLALAVAAACVAAAALLGAAAGALTTPPDPPEPARLAASGFSVEAPASWSRARPSAAPFETGADTLVARPAADPSVGLAITGSGDALLASARGVAPEAVALRAGDAWRYPGVRIGDTTADVYLLHTATGPIIAACYGPTAAGRAPLERCGAIAGSLRAVGAEPLPLGGAPAVRASVAEALAELQRDRADARRDLAAARRSNGQIAAAATLADAYAEAARAAGGTETVGLPGARTRLVDELMAASRSYVALADAASVGDAAAFDAARTRIAARERAVDRATESLAPAASGD